MLYKIGNQWINPAFITRIRFDDYFDAYYALPNGASTDDYEIKMTPAEFEELQRLAPEHFAAASKTEVAPAEPALNPDFVLMEDGYFGDPYQRLKMVNSLIDKFLSKSVEEQQTDYQELRMHEANLYVRDKILAPLLLGKPTAPAQDETLDDLSVQVDEAFYELNEGVVGASPELQHRVGNAQKAWREFSKRALAAPAESTAPRHPDFEEWYQSLEEGEDVRFPYVTVYLDDERTVRFIVQMNFSQLKDAKLALADLQNAIALAEQWNKDAEANNDGIGWNDHHEGK